MGDPIEELPSVPPPIVAVPISAAAFAGGSAAGPVGTARRFDAAEAFEREFGTEGGLRLAVRAFFANGGAEAVVVRVDEEERGADWLAALEREPFGMLHLARGEDAGGWPASEVLGAAASWCREHRVLLVADAPQDAGAPEDAVAFAEELAAQAQEAAGHVALYVPHLLGSSTGGAVAGIIARYDPWRAPAGREATIAGADELSVALHESAADELAQRGVNPLRALPDGPIAVWGARTLSTDAEWKYVNVRRLDIFFESSLDAGMQWVAFEPNGEPLWESVRRVVGDFLHGLWREGALQGTTPDEAFFVRCDRTTMTQADIDAGRLIVTIGVAPLRPAEFVVIEIGRWLTAQSLHDQ